MFNAVSTATLRASISSSTFETPKLTLQPTYAGFPVRFAKIFATRVANSIDPVTVQRDVHRGSLGWKR